MLRAVGLHGLPGDGELPHDHQAGTEEPHWGVAEQYGGAEEGPQKSGNSLLLRHFSQKLSTCSIQSWKEWLYCSCYASFIKRH